MVAGELVWVLISSTWYRGRFICYKIHASQPEKRYALVNMEPQAILAEERFVLPLDDWKTVS